MGTSMWDRTEDMAKRHDQAGGVWLRLQNDGDAAVVVFLGEPYPREVVFVDGKYELFREEHRAQGLKASLRVALNVALPGSNEVKILEQGIVFFKTLLGLRAKYGLDRYSFEVKRHGAAKDPRTSYTILPEQPLTPEQQREYRALPLHDLAKLYGDEGAGGGPTLGSYDRAPDGPIDPKAAQAIVVALKTLPREAVDRFLSEFGVQRVKDLPAARAEKASAFVENLRAQYAQPANNTGDVDPFAD